MNGIKKISARILADAETEAAAIRAQAGEKAAQLRADYDRRIELEQQRLTAEAQAEADKQLERDRRRLPAGGAAASLAPHGGVYEALRAACRTGKRVRQRGADLLRRGPRTGRTGRRGAGERAAPEGREGSKADAFRRNAADARRRGAEGRAGRDELLDRHNDKRPAARAFRQGCGLPVWLRPGG